MTPAERKRRQRSKAIMLQTLERPATIKSNTPLYGWIGVYRDGRERALGKIPGGAPDGRRSLGQFRRALRIMLESQATDNPLIVVEIRAL